MSPSTPRPPPVHPSTCALCGHSDRAALDAALRDGVPVAEVGRRAGVSRTSVRRHRDARHHEPSVPPSIDVPAINRRTGEPVPPMPPEPPPPEGDPALLDLVAELAAQEVPTLPTRQRPGARRVIGDLTREATRRRVEQLVGLVEGFLQRADDERFDDDLGGRASLVSACVRALALLAEILGVRGGGAELARALAQIEAMYEALMAPEHRGAAEAVRDRLRALEQGR